MKFGRELAGEAFFNEARKLIDDNYRSIRYGDRIKLNPDLKNYEAAEAHGMMRLYTIRDDVDQLIGYMMFSFRTHMHHRTLLSAFHDILYIKPEYRGVSLIKRFLTWCDTELKNDGVSVIYQVLPYKNGFQNRLRSLGYEPLEITYSKIL